MDLYSLESLMWLLLLNTVLVSFICHDGVITHLESDILESKVRWALGSITMNKASGGDGIPVEHFKS